MAEIPIEKKGTPAWLWILLLLALLVVAWLIWEAFDRDEIDTVAPIATDTVATAVVDTAPPVTATAVAVPVETLAVVVDAPDRAALAGRAIRIEEASVVRVLGDKTFTVGEPGRELLVVIDPEVPTPDTRMEGRVDVNADSTVSFTGTIERMPPAAEARSQWDVSEMSDGELSRAGVYVKARVISVAGQEPKGAGQL